LSADTSERSVRNASRLRSPSSLNAPHVAASAGISVFLSHVPFT
jgi:hypothetical protein